MIRLKSKDEIKQIEESCKLLSQLFILLRQETRAGITTAHLDNIARTFIQDHKASPAFLGYMEYPAALCVSVNEEVIHGIPGKRILKPGDIVGLDCGINLNGFFSDAAITVPIEPISQDVALLLRVTQECLDQAISVIKPDIRIHDISKVVYNHAKKFGFGVVRDYCGHGVGFSQHEDPQVPNYVSSGPNPRLKCGMVLAIEPMINLGVDSVFELDDGWTVVTADGKPSAHFEHTVAVTESGARVLTNW